MDEDSVRSMISDLRDDMVEKIEKLRTDLRDEIHALREEIESLRSQIIPFSDDMDAPDNHN